MKKKNAHASIENRRPSNLSMWIAVVAILTTASLAPAKVVEQYSNAADGAAYGSGNFPTQDLIVGGATGANYAGIAFFQLPELGTSFIHSATLTYTVVTAGTMPTANADVWGLGYLTSGPAMSSSWLLTADSETRDGDTLGTNLGSDLPTKLGDNVVTAGTTMNVGNTTVITGVGLVDFLTDLYDVYGASAGDWVVFRVNPDADQFNVHGSGSNFRYGGSQRGASATLLSLTIIPAPAALPAGLMMLAAIGARRRRR